MLFGLDYADGIKCFGSFTGTGLLLHFMDLETVSHRNKRVIMLFSCLSVMDCLRERGRFSEITLLGLVL